MKNEEIIYRTSPEIFDNVVRVVSVPAVILLAINFQINPVAFSLMIVFFISLFLFTATKKITIRENDFIISTYRIVSKNQLSFSYEDVREIKYKTGWIYRSVLWIPFLDYFFSIDLEVILKNGENFNFNLEGLRWKEVKKCIGLINEQISKSTPNLPQA